MSQFVGYIYPFRLNSAAEGRRMLEAERRGGKQTQNLGGRYSNMGARVLVARKLQ
jgi:hypothetical protein